MTTAPLPNSRIRKVPGPLYLQARRQILALIESGVFAPGTQLPREEELAKALGVSRPTVREALALLQTEGIVTRRHGSGNFVNHVPRAITARIDDLVSIPRIIAEHGFTSRMSGLKIDTIRAPEPVARALGLTMPAQVSLIQRLYIASGRPAVWVTDYMSAGRVQRPEQWRSFDGDMLRFLQEECQTAAAYAVATIEVVNADVIQATRLRVGVGAGVLRITQTAYSSTNTPINYSIGFHRPGVITYSLIRKARS